MESQKEHKGTKLSMRQHFNNEKCLLIWRGAFRSVIAIGAKRNRINEISSAHISQHCYAFAQPLLEWQDTNAFCVCRLATRHCQLLLLQSALQPLVGFWPAQLSLSLLSRKVFTECCCQQHVKPSTWRTHCQLYEDIKWRKTMILRQTYVAGNNKTYVGHRVKCPMIHL